MKILTKTLQHASLAKPVLRMTRPLASRSLTIGDFLEKKEHVEEQRYMRELENKFIAAKRAEFAQESKAREKLAFETTIAPAMAEAQSLLEKGDKLSHASLESIAKWKLGI